MKDVTNSEAMFWADQCAAQAIARAKREGGPVTVRSGQTPSGGKHIGNLNDVVRAALVWKAASEKKAKTNFVNTHDDRDPLKDIPVRLADLDGKWHSSDKFPNLRKYLGWPLCRIPDPFGCCSSYGTHFANLWNSGLESLGIRPEQHYNDLLYKKGKFDPYIRKVFEKIELSGEILARYQATKAKGYIPFDVICPKCGVLTNISGFDLDSWSVEFTCGGKAIKKKKAEGCGFKGTASIKEGKLQWRFEWPAQWAIFNTTFEPFGKDHWEGSWPSGQEIAKRVYGIEPPIPFVYEFFLVNGEKMSASRGNVYIIQDMLNVMEAEPFLYFYTKRPGKQRNMDLKSIYVLVEDFDRAERIFFDAEKEENEREKANIKRSYEIVMEKIPSKIPFRIDYRFAAMLSQTYQHEDVSQIADMLKRIGNIKKELTKEDLTRIGRRLKLAKNWVDVFAPEHRISISESVKPDVRKNLSEQQKGALRDLAKELKRDLTEDSLYNLFWEIAKAHKLKASEMFEAAYQVILGSRTGPRLAPLILAFGKEKIVNLLKQV